MSDADAVRAFIEDTAHKSGLKLSVVEHHQLARGNFDRLVEHLGRRIRNHALNQGALALACAALTVYTGIQALERGEFRVVQDSWPLVSALVGMYAGVRAVQGALMMRKLKLALEYGSPNS